VADALGKALAECGGSEVRVLLEDTAGAGGTMGRTFEDLAAIIASVGGDPRLGLCLDTAHLWGAGHAIDTVEGVDDLLAAFDDAVGLARLRLVHLNDSRSAAGSGSDRHEHLGGGRIGVAGLSRFLVHPGLSRVAYIVETPGMEDGWDEVNLARARDLVAGRPLAPLPPDAFNTRSGRGRAAPPEEQEEAGGAEPGLETGAGARADRPRRGRAEAGAE